MLCAQHPCIATFRSTLQFIKMKARDQEKLKTTCDMPQSVAIFHATRCWAHIATKKLRMHPVLRRAAAIKKDLALDSGHPAFKEGLDIVNWICKKMWEWVARARQSWSLQQPCSLRREPNPSWRDWNIGGSMAAQPSRCRCLRARRVPSVGRDLRLEDCTTMCSCCYRARSCH